MALVATTVALAGCSAAPTTTPPRTTAPITTSAAAPVAAPRTGMPDLTVDVLADGLSHVWDMGFLPDGQVLFTERDGRVSLLSGTEPGATVTPVDADFSDVFVNGEGGLMGLVVHADFDRTRRFTTCQTNQVEDTATDIRLVTWELSADGGSATRVANPLLGGLPINPSGRHSGCRTTLAPDGTVYVATGDTARGTIPQDLNSLGGKVLHIDVDTAGPAPDNPFVDDANPARRLIYTYGHRNVQGVTVQPDTGDVFSAEHGPDTDDEVNHLEPGANYGWDPSQGGTVGGYDEDVPMTDLDRFPDAVAAIWSSGSPVEAISGAEFISGPQWGDLDGALAVGALRGQKLLVMRLAEDGSVAEVLKPAPLDGEFGRLRGVRLAPDGSLLVSTSNGRDDKILRVTPV
ncbi:PQQ-dependent sugar dehydrogenase [Pseudonocardia lacus]|uniref:PQQ-dependent sugar dehydrogenase n=1 Tax=Pseudonocardia lacus TaxID=2835865 RepID=UPI0027E3977A|nr:PQQ-dependent sugar dehydrogenase [Pseudonocardia lacus]